CESINSGRKIAVQKFYNGVEVKRRKLEKPDDDEKWSRNPIKLWNNADKMCKGDISG
ncbi:6977_t:CDS:1, partial [Paraglomus brasilianum]